MNDADRQLATKRIALALLVAAGWAILCYFLVDVVRPDEGFVTVSFVMIQPAAINAFIAIVGDPLRRRRLRFYLLVPLVSAAGMIVVSIFALQEGAVCVVMLSPLWVLFGMAGTGLAWKLRPRETELDHVGDTFQAHGLLVLPLLAMALESMLPVPVAHYTVTREVVIDAPAEDIWPMMQGMGSVAPDEGQWNVSQSVIGLPRPEGAWLESEGLGAIRNARWQRGVVFSEVVTDWQPDQRIGWQFDFAGSRGWDITDPHLRPDGPYMRIETGGYELERLPDGKHVLRLHTTYAAQTHFNGYASLWGELFLGDIQANVLEVIRQRAESQD